MELSGKLTNKISLSGKLARNSSLSGTIMRSAGGAGGAVNSVNGQTGDVVLTAQDVGALPSSTVIPSKTSDLQNDSGFITASGAAAAAPVQSVNGQTGAVTVSGLSQETKQALMDCFANTAWAVNNGQTYYDALASALGLRVLSSITAVFTQGSAVIYNTDSLDTLTQYLVVTANYSDSTTKTVTDYTLSGTLTAGTSTITVAYGGQADTFSVAVTLNTNAQIEYANSLFYKSTAVEIREKPHSGCTYKIALIAPSTTLNIAGIIPHVGLFSKGSGLVVIYDANGNFVNYVDENNNASTSVNTRWAQVATGTLTEYQQSWNVNSFSQIAFSVDMRYLDDAYMYFVPTGQVLFAGKNTPYFGMHNISEAE